MSTLKADTIQSTSGGAATLTKQHAAKFWIQFDGTGTVGTRDSFNAASLTDNATGDYTHGFTNAMTNNDYSPVGMGAGSVKSGFYNEANTTTTTFRQLFRNESGTDTDNDPSSMTMHGDLA